MKKRTKIILILTPVLLVIGVVAYVVCGLLIQMNKFMAWDNLHHIMYQYNKYFHEHPEAAVDFGEEPLELSSINPEILKQLESAVKVYPDRWGTPMRFFFIKKNDYVYGKGISAGRDRVFSTSDDIIDSEYDKTGNTCRKSYNEE